MPSPGSDHRGGHPPGGLPPPPAPARVLTSAGTVTQTEPIAPGTLPAPDPSPADRRRWWWSWWVPVVLLVAAGLGVGAATIRLDYFAIIPGSTYATEELVTIEGAPTYPSEGEVMFVTVTIRQVTLIGALWGWLDPQVDVKPRRVLFGDRSAEENRQLNQVLMESSIATSTQAALRYLDMGVSGGGAAVVAVVPGFPAEGALEVGDVIVAVDGAPVRFSDELVDAVRSRSPGTTVVLTVQRAEETLEVPVTLADDGAGGPILGVQVQTHDLRLPFQVDIDPHQIGGPSAGLAFALTIIDELTPGELTGGHLVAATGTIEADGDVGPIGGVRQKVEAVEAAGAELFIVPSANYAEALTMADDDLRVVAVDNLAEAVAALVPLGGNAAEYLR